MKKLLCIAAACAIIFTLAGCARTADANDNTKDGTVGSGTAAGDMMEDVGDDIRNGIDDMKDGIENDRNTNNSSGADNSGIGNAENGRTPAGKAIRDSDSGGFSDDGSGFDHGSNIILDGRNSANDLEQ